MRTNLKMAQYAVLAAIAVLIAGTSPAWANQKQKVDRQDDLAGVCRTANQQSGRVATLDDSVGAITQKQQQSGSGDVMATFLQNAIDVAFVPNATVTVNKRSGIARLDLDHSNLARDDCSTSTMANPATAAWKYGGAIAASGDKSFDNSAHARAGVVLQTIVATAVKTP